MHSQTHTFAVKVWKWLCMTTEQPKALQGINNRPNLRQQTQSVGCWGKWGVMFVNMCECVWMWGVLVDMNMWLACVCGFLLGWAVSCLCACVFALAGVIAFLVCVCMSVNNEPPYLCYSTGLLWPPRTCWLLHSNPPKTFRPKKNK